MTDRIPEVEEAESRLWSEIRKNLDGLLSKRDYEERQAEADALAADYAQRIATLRAALTTAQEENETLQRDYDLLRELANDEAFAAQEEIAMLRLERPRRGDLIDQLREEIERLRNADCPELGGHWVAVPVEEYDALTHRLQAADALAEAAKRLKYVAANEHHGSQIATWDTNADELNDALGKES